MTTHVSLCVAERRLQAAQLASDVVALDALLDERLVFTGPDGALYSKKDDLALVDGRTGVTWFLGTLEGAFGGVPFAARVRCTRTWLHDDAHGWRIVAAHLARLEES